MNETKKMTGQEKAGPGPVRAPETALPGVDIYENPEEILLLVEMPGVAREDIRIDLDNGRLALSGTRPERGSRQPLYAEFGPVEFRRSFSVPQTIDGSKVKAELRDGVLNLHLPKSEAFKPRIIEIHEG